MAKDATTTAGVFIDDLFPAIDDIRQTLHDGDCRLGIRTSNVYVVVRTWEGPRLGEGNPSDVHLWLQPTPRLVGLGPTGRLRPPGLEEEGEVYLTQVSLAHAESELYRADESLSQAVEMFYVVSEKEGQSARPRFYVPKGPPFTHRGNSRFPRALRGLGWVIPLRRISDVPQYTPPTFDYMTIDGEQATIDGDYVIVEV